jgi:hypothetical protein
MARQGGGAARADPQGSARWLFFVAQLPVDDPAGRMKVLRTLEMLGCAVMREGVYLLPESPENRQGLRRLAEYVDKIHGAAHLLEVASVDEAQTRRFREMFDRSAKYRDLIKTVESLAAGFGVSDPSAIARVLAKQRSDLESIGALDFFASPLKQKAEKTLSDMEETVRRMMFPDDGATSPSARVARSNREYFRRAWATRKPLSVDRLASAWLIRRFIDPEAIMVWLDKRQTVPSTAVGFGFEGATFRNTRSRVTYEELLSSFRLDGDGALVKIGRIVHALDAGDAPVAEAAGVQTLLNGAKRRAETEDTLLAESEKTFDLLYEAYYELPAKA